MFEVEAFETSQDGKTRYIGIWRSETAEGVLSAIEANRIPGKIYGIKSTLSNRSGFVSDGYHGNGETRPRREAEVMGRDGRLCRIRYIDTGDESSAPADALHNDGSSVEPYDWADIEEVWRTR